MKLSKTQREAIRSMFGGKCAYCGHDLGKRWHADHVEPVLRDSKYVKGKGFVPTGVMLRPENDHIGNLMPACVPCNIRKHASSLEGFRQGIQRSLDVLKNNYSAYRHALRFGMIEENPKPLVFYFERYQEEVQTPS